MLFDFGWSEILLIGGIALVFIGPKDLPKAMRVAGYWVRKARNLSREFQSSIDQMIREAELDEMRQELKKAAEFDLNKEFHNTIDPTGSLSESLKPPELPSFAATEPAAMAPNSEVAKQLAPTAAVPAAPASVEAVPMVAAPQSELDQVTQVAPSPPASPSPRPSPPPEIGPGGFVPPKP